MIFLYDKTFEGLLSAVFYAYSNKCFPNRLLEIDSTLPITSTPSIAPISPISSVTEATRVMAESTPAMAEATLFTELAAQTGYTPTLFDPIEPKNGCSKTASTIFGEPLIKIATSTQQANRVWKGLQKRLSPSAMNCITTVWLSEMEHIDELIFRYICKAFDSNAIELNFADSDVLQMSKIFKKVSNERLRVIQFLRFQKAKDGTYFAPIEPLYNVLSLTIPHFTDRFRDQEWIIYDLKRGYGYYYNKKLVQEITFTNETADIPGRANTAKDTPSRSGTIPKHLQDSDQQLYEELWQTYFNAVCIKERINPKLHKQNLPVRFWKHLTEKQALRNKL